MVSENRFKEPCFCHLLIKYFFKDVSLTNPTESDIQANITPIPFLIPQNPSK